MNNNITDKGLRSCTGCSVCSAVCRSGAAVIAADSEGFYNPRIQSGRCSGCGACKDVCYKYDRDIVITSEVLLCASARNNNPETVQRSSSGGISEALAEYFLDNGYKIVGCAYSYEKEIAETIIIHDKNDLYKIRGSKYFQSSTEDAFKEILQSDSKYAVFGAPCQIYALRIQSRMQNAEDRIILIDFFCHGVASLNIWAKYNEMIKNKMGADRFDSIEFRSKAREWHKFCICFSAAGKKWVSPAANDSFHTLFFSKDFFNDACYDCIPRSTMGYSDIRMGDFWGFRYDSDAKGVSLLCAATEKGLKAVRGCEGFKLLDTDISFSEAVAGQSYGAVHKYDEKRRKKIMGLLGGETGISDILRQYRRMLPLKSKIWNIYKNMIKRLPIGISGRIKSIVRRKFRRVNK
jgi:coenzyme F420-reducing hydrogenase beta subunit